MRPLLLGVLLGASAWSTVALADAPRSADAKAPLVVAAPDATAPTTDVPPAIAPKASSTLNQATTPPPPLAKAPPKQAPPPKPYVEPKKPKRWYGWQVLLVHGLSDMLVVGGLIGMESDLGGGFAATALAPIVRGLGTGILEAAHHDTAAGVLWGAGNFLLPLLGAAGIGQGIAGDRERKEEEDVEPVFARGWAAGMLVGGSVITAIEASVAFEDKPVNVGVHVSPSFASVSVAF